MPFSTLPAAGFEAQGGLLFRARRHPYPTQTMRETVPPAPCSESRPPKLPGEPAELVPTFDQYLGADTAPPVYGSRLADVCVEHGVWMHPSWAQTALAPALRPPEGKHDKAAASPDAEALLLDINAVTPDMIESMPTETRQSLMTILGDVRDIPVRWRDPSKAGQTHRVLGIPVSTWGPDGKVYERHRHLGLPLGKHYRVSAATGLAMAMCQVDDHRPFIDAAAAGLPSVVEELTGNSLVGMFTLYDTTQILVQVLQDLPRLGPVDFRVRLDAASTLVQRYCEEHCDGTPDVMRVAFEALLHSLVPLVPRDVDHIGLCIGILITGITKYGVSLSGDDNRRRWRIAAAVNFIWAASSWAPLFFVAGPVATSVVGGGIVWDRLHPVRDYNELIGRFETELSQLLLTSDEPWLHDAALGRLYWRLRQSIRAPGLSG